MVLRFAHWLLRIIALVPLVALLAIGWALYCGPNTQVGFGSRTRALTGQEPEVEMLGWHVIGWAVFAILAARWLTLVLLPAARAHIARVEYRRLRAAGNDEERSMSIALERAWDFPHRA